MANDSGTVGPLAAPLRDMQLAPEDEKCRLRFFGALADCELLLLLEEAPGEDDISPVLITGEAGRFVVTFDSDVALATYAGSAAYSARVPGRALAGMLLDQDVGFVLNPQATPNSETAEPDAGPDAGPDTGPDAGPDTGPDAGPDRGPNVEPAAGPDAGPDRGPNVEPAAGPDAHFFGPEAVTWLHAMLRDAPEPSAARPDEIRPPRNVPEDFLKALEQALLRTSGQALRAWLVEAHYPHDHEGPPDQEEPDGGAGLLLAFEGATPGAEAALAGAVGAALKFSGVENLLVDVGFPETGSTLLARIGAVGARFDIPEPARPAPPRAPGTDPDTPPKLR